MIARVGATLSSGCIAYGTRVSVAGYLETYKLQDRASALDKVLIARHPTVQSSALFGYQGTILPDGDWRDATTNVLWENDRLPTRDISRS